MASYSKATVDSHVRNEVFSTLQIANLPGFQKLNDRSFGTLVTDINGHQRFVRIAAIVAEEKDDMTAAEVMKGEINSYTMKQQTKANRKAERETKAKRDDEKRAKIAAEKAAKAAEVAASK